MIRTLSTIPLALLISCNPPPHANNGWALVQKKDYKRAIAEFELSTQKERIPDGYLGLYHSYSDLGQPEQASVYLDQGIKAYPKAWPLYAARGHHRIKLNKYDEGISDLESAMKLFLEQERVEGSERKNFEKIIADAKQKRVEHLESKS